MISQEQIRLMQEEREREVEAELRVRRLLGTRRPFIRWLPHRQAPGSRRR
jgi:hypothetical protein